MAGIFINYRRDDAAGFARSLYEHLDQEFKRGQVFMDVEQLREPGMDFVKEIERSLSRCGVMLVLIGKSWLDSVDASGRRRIDLDDDFVHLEIATALRRDVRVMPVLLNGAAMPPSETLPEDLQILGRRQAIAITHDDWAHDVSRLVEAIAKVPGVRKRSARGREGWSTRSMVIAGSAGAALGLGLLVWAGFRIENGQKPDPTDAALRTTQNQGTESQVTAEPPPIEQTPVQQPAQLVSEPAVATPSRDDVYEAQILLATLGYDPGVVDGAYGPATIGAIGAYQRDQGYAVTGTVDAQLLAQLRETSQNRSTAAAGTQTAVAQQPASYEDSASNEEADSKAFFQAAATALANMPLDVSGTWYDNNGLSAELIQQGNTITVAALNPATGMPQVIGTGVVQGRFVTINYQNFAGVPGSVQAELAPDGMHMSGTDTNALLNIPVPNTWHRNHPPSD